MTSTASDVAELQATRLGIHRATQPRGSLPHMAQVLDAATPPNEYEAELDVQALNVDATSFRVIRQQAGGDPERMAELVSEIVSEHGKLQNPWTGSGGVLMGQVRTVGERHAGLTPGDLVVPLASLIAIPLMLHSVGPVDPADPLVPVRGRAIVTGAMLCARVPEDLSAPVALAVLDVYPVASHVRELARPGSHVLVLGAGHAGLLALAAARAAVGAEGTLSSVDISSTALDRAVAVDPAVNPIAADVTDPATVVAALGRRNLPAADLTLACTSVDGAEGAALLATARRGTVIFFSTATRFAAAALGADAIGSQAQLLIPCGLTDDRGDYAFELVRMHPELRAAFEAGRA